MRLTTEEIRTRYNYDPETGALTRLVRMGRFPVGSSVGSVNNQGYMRTADMAIHRLVWQHTYGFEPPEFIDHINGNRADNRIANLRLANNSLNQANRTVERGGSSSLRGVTWNKSAGRWQAQIKVRGRSIYLGLHWSEQEAHKAYCCAARAHFGNYARTA